VRGKFPVAVAAALLAAARAVAGGAVPVISVDEIRPGARGYGLTVVEGSEPSRFEVEVLGVIPKIAPDRDAVIFRAEGLRLERTGIFGGMSGSPVYIDGRLAGAVSFGWSWQKDPVAGLTPMADILEGAAQRSRERPAAPALTAEGLLSLIEGRPAAPAPQSRSAPGGPVTLATSGLSAAAADLVREFFPEERFLIADMAPAGAAPEGSGGEKEEDAAGRAALQPGSSIYAALVSGDLFLGALGTVTERRGEEIYGFGHPFLNLDSVAMPMYAARVITIFPSTQRSFKIAVPEKVVGAITRDFATGIYGRLGAQPETFPVSVTVERGGGTRRYDYEVFRHFAISPQLVAVAAAESLTSLADAPPEATVSYGLNVEYEGGRTLSLKRSRAGRAATSEMARDLAGLFSTTMHNPLEDLLPEKVEITAVLEDENRTARIESVLLRENEVRPGDTLSIDVRVKPLRAAAETFVLEIAVPAGAVPGTVPLMICDGETSNTLDLLEARHRLDPGTVDDLLAVLEPRRSARELVARLSGAGYGLSHADKEFPNLPAPALAMLAAAGDTSPAPIFESAVSAVETPYVLSGRKVVPVIIKPPGKEN